MELDVPADQIVEPAHVTVQHRNGGLQRLELLLVRIDVLQQPDLFLGHDVDPGSELVVLLADLVCLARSGDQRCLVSEPRPLQLLRLAVLEVDLFVDALDASFQRAHALLVLHSIQHLFVLPVEPVDAVHLLLDLVVPLSDLHLVLFDELVLLPELDDALLHRVPELNIVCLSVQGVDLDTGHLVLDVGCLDFLLVNLQDDGLLHLGQVLGCLSRGDLLVPIDGDALLQEVPLPDGHRNVLPDSSKLLPDNHSTGLHLHLLFEGRLHGTLEHREAGRDSLALSPDGSNVVVDELALGLEPVLHIDESLILSLALENFPLQAINLGIIILRSGLGVLEGRGGGAERLVAAG
mmetsp:Transcript_16073/g.30115  ORF Transcript_16073/g.30115 Transcript_16073/m.30115 type:complete len:350 (+) Transcript_16073:949-1998(+)